MIEATKILTPDEVQQVLKDFRRYHKRKKNRAINRVIFRLSCCCGLREMEICGLRIKDVSTGGARPAIRIRKENTKGEKGKRRPRMVPLWWDAGTKEDLESWKQKRLQEGASPGDLFLTSMKGSGFGRTQIARRWKTAIKCLGEDRVDQLSCHCGRHSFASHALNAGRSLVEVQRAMGHANVQTTSVYLHLIEREGVRDVFAVPE